MEKRIYVLKRKKNKISEIISAENANGTTFNYLLWSRTTHNFWGKSPKETSQWMIPNEVEVSRECNRKYQTGKQYLNFTLFFWLFSLYVKKNIIIKPARANSILAISSSRAVHVTFQAGEGAKKKWKGNKYFHTWWWHGKNNRKTLSVLILVNQIDRMR